MPEQTNYESTLYFVLLTLGQTESYLGCFFEKRLIIKCIETFAKVIKVLLGD
jgi:hypothetical protein